MSTGTEICDIETQLLPKLSSFPNTKASPMPIQSEHQKRARRWLDLVENPSFICLTQV